MQIVSFKAENIKRLVAAEITPRGNVVEITGRNGQGKTSVLDAIWWALGGKKPVQSKPVRKGASKGVIELDLGEYTVTKTFKVKDDGDYSETLAVRNKDGFKAGSPQDVLNGFLGSLTFDPLAFSHMKAREQVVALRALVPGYDFAAAEADNKADYETRTDVNRDVLSLKKRIEAIEVPEGTPAERVSIEALVSELNDAMDHNGGVDREVGARLMARDAINRLDADMIHRAQQINEAKRRIEDMEKANIAAATEMDRLREMADRAVVEKVDLDPIRQRIAASEATNRNVDLLAQRTDLAKQLKAQEAEAADLTKAIDERKAEAAKAVREADLPVDGLELTEDAVLLNGQPFDQASDAEKLRVSVAVAGAMNPKLRVVRVRDGSLLDKDSWAALEKYAEANKVQIWCETVESGRESAVVIENGMVAGQQQAAE